MTQTDIAWIEANTPLPALALPVSAAKLHVLHIGPIRERLGPRWLRLSLLVHKLFEKALGRAQGPHDHFVLVDELSYIATFHGLSPEEAALACAAVAKEVCELLFGEGSEQVSVRSMIGTTPGPVLDLPRAEAAKMAAALERNGRQIIVTRHQHQERSADWLSGAHAHAALLRRAVGFHPAWDLTKKRSQWLLLAMDMKLPHRRGPLGVQRALGPGESVAGMEVSLLRAAAAYGVRIEAAGQIGAVTVGVSWATLCCAQPRHVYIQALKASRISPASPLFIKIEQIPKGMPLGRLGEFAALLTVPGVRVLLEFEHVRAIPPLDIRLGVAGIGAMLPEHCEPDEVRRFVRRLRDHAADQKAFAFLEGLDTPGLAEAAITSGLKFGAGAAFVGKALSGLEDVPTLPLPL